MEPLGRTRSSTPTIARAPLEEAWTIPAPWYIDARIAELERRTVFSRTWQMVGRADQVEEPGQYITAELAGEPIVVVRGRRRQLRGFFNVCRHHAAAVDDRGRGQGRDLRCPYHGWTYSLDGELRGTPDFAGVCNFDAAKNGLVPVETATWEKLVFVRLEPGGPSLEEFLGADSSRSSRRSSSAASTSWSAGATTFECNWKVFVDNYLDGGYHIPYLHKGLDSVLRLQPVHDRERRPLLPPVEPDRSRAPRRRRARCAGATARSTTGSTRTS